MRAPQQIGSRRSDREIGASGQALVELAMALPIFVVLVLGVVDFSRAIYDLQVIANLAAEGSSMASRGTTVSTTATTLLTASALNLGTSGRVIVSAVYNDSSKGLLLTDQSSQGGLSVSSKIGSTLNGSATLPSNAVPPVTQTVYVTEVYVSYQSLTPIGRFVTGLTFPGNLYDIAYY